MILHASAFCLFVISVGVFTFYYAKYLIIQTRRAADEFLFAEILMLILSFFSQILLCVIFV